MLRSRPGAPVQRGRSASASPVDRLRNQLLLPASTATRARAYAVPHVEDSFPKRLAARSDDRRRRRSRVSLTAGGDALESGGASRRTADDLDSLLAFQRDLETRGLADRVLVHVWSEFGRRAQENGNAGTDHGAAGVGFLIGTRAKGTMVGEFPGLATGLDEDGNVKATSDFRGIYAGLLEQWLGTDAGAVIPDAGSFARPALVK
jgi:uncharacterized protein (DUF1501 family)